MNDQNKTSARGDMADEPIMINGRFYYTAEQMRRGIAAGWDCEIRELRAAFNLAQAEIKQWKAKHDDVVKRCALLRERDDLPVDRIPAYRELIRLQAIASEKSKVTPSDITQGFEEFTLSLPKGAQKNVQDSQLRGESITYMAFIKGSAISGDSND